MECEGGVADGRSCRQARHLELPSPLCLRQARISCMHKGCGIVNQEQDFPIGISSPIGSATAVQNFTNSELHDFPFWNHVMTPDFATTIFHFTLKHTLTQSSCADLCKLCETPMHSLYNNHDTIPRATSATIARELLSCGTSITSTSISSPPSRLLRLRGELPCRYPQTGSHCEPTPECAHPTITTPPLHLAHRKLQHRFTPKLLPPHNDPKSPRPPLKKCVALDHQYQYKNLQRAQPRARQENFANPGKF